MKSFLLAGLTILGLIIPSLAVDESEEPLLGYTLNIGEQKVRVEAGRETVVQGNFENPKVTLQADTEKHFTYAGLDFRYPAYFAFEAAMETEGIRIWTLSGNGCVLIIQHYHTVAMNAEEFAKGLKGQYGKSATAKPTSRKFNHQTFHGLQVTAKIAGVQMTQDVLAFDTKGGCRLLIIQQSDGDNAASKEEFERVIKLLNTTLQVKPLPKMDSALH